MNDESYSDTVESSLKQLAETVSTREEIQAALNTFAAHVGLPSLTLDEKGDAECIVDDELPLTFAHWPHLPGIVVAAPLPPAAKDHDAVLRMLLQANMSWAQTQGGSFALVPPSNEPMLCRLIPLVATDAEALDRQLTEFVDLVQAWYEEIELYLDSLDVDVVEEKVSSTVAHEKYLRA